MASAKKKLDEKNLKILRELVSLPENKHCFDCKQRGPTYINMTIGSFVCTTCSGMLRGLTPPHRVKSITMATFSQEEIDFISSRGNEYCRNVWLGQCDSHQLGKDEEQIKDFMISKYEKKRYYVKPSEEKPNQYQNGWSPNNKSITQIPKIPLLSTSLSSPSSNDRNLINNNLKKNKNNNAFPDIQIASDKNFADPFSSATSGTSSSTNFANFDNNPVFSSTSTQTVEITFSNFNPNPWDESHQESLNPFISNNFTAAFEKSQQPPSEDRYAALKALDCLMKSQNEPAPSQTQPNSTWEQTNVTWPPASIFDSNGRNDHSEETTANPFTFENSWNEQKFVGNPFETGESAWTGNFSISKGVTNSQSMNFNQSQPFWDFNPFSPKVNSNQPSHHSSNPFL